MYIIPYSPPRRGREFFKSFGKLLKEKKKEGKENEKKEKKKEGKKGKV